MTFVTSNIDIVASIQDYQMSLQAFLNGIYFILCHNPDTLINGYSLFQKYMDKLELLQRSKIIKCTEGRFYEERLKKHIRFSTVRGNYPRKLCIPELSYRASSAFKLYRN